MGVILSGCLPAPQVTVEQQTQTVQTGTELASTPLPTRDVYEPGQLVDYVAQDGDTIPALAARFNTSAAEILQQNSFIPNQTTTMPPGMPMKIPIYFTPFWGSPYQIIPDRLFVNGPAQIDFNIEEFIASHSGWLKDYHVYAFGGWRSGAELIAQISRSYSVSPRLILALLEYQAAALSNPVPPENVDTYLLGYVSTLDENLYYQLILLVDNLNDGYYRWRDASKLTIELQNGKEERFDPWQNAATVALHTYFAQILPADDYQKAVSANGFAATYKALFGDPWQSTEMLIPGSLNQPDLLLPFTPDKTWSYSGGPHPVWGVKQPWAAIDFAPPSEEGGCVPSAEWVTAVADGVIARTETGVAILDLDGDGDERTGWNILYLHLSREEMVPLGRKVKAGDVLGHPSCERGDATGTHIHIGRKFNGEWINSYGALPFNLEGWIVTSAGTPYLGELTRHAKVVEACDCGDATSNIQSRK